MNKLVDFNINQNVAVRLTSAGRIELKRQWDELHKECPRVFREYKPRTECADGYSRWQMHNLMSELGRMCVMGCELPFHPDIRLEMRVT